MNPDQTTPNPDADPVPSLLKIYGKSLISTTTDDPSETPKNVDEPTTPEVTSECTSSTFKPNVRFFLGKNMFHEFSVFQMM